MVPASGGSEGSDVIGSTSDWVDRGDGRRHAVVDVFSTDPFRGNPVAVVLDGDGLEDEDMAAISRWTNLSETTFLLPPTTAEADYRVRIFTPSTELPFAGHPTLGSCRAWLAGGGSPRHEGRIVQECGVGLVEVAVQGEEALAFRAPAPVRTGPLEPALLAEVVAALGVAPSAVLASAHVDNGPGWVAVLLGTADEVLAIEVTDSPHAIGVVGFHPHGAGAAYEVRAFFPESGLSIEDPVTGSLNASVAQWLLAEGRVTAPYRATQGGRVGRTGVIEVAQDRAGDVWVGGAATVRVIGWLAAGR